MGQAINDFFGEECRVQSGRVTVSVPAISENGYSVPLSVAVDSPMTADDYVRRLLVVSQSNPLPIIESFELGPKAGLAQISTRIRLADSQRIYAIAEMHDGALVRLWIQRRDLGGLRHMSAQPTIRLAVPESVAAGEVIEIKVMIQHAMESGYRRGALGERISRHHKSSFAAAKRGKRSLRRSFIRALPIRC